MGQYFQFINFDKKEFIDCYDFDAFAKEMEHSYVGNKYVNAAVSLLADRWSGDRVMHVGDYAEELAEGSPSSDNGAELVKALHNEFNIPYKDNSLYHFATEHFKKITPDEISIKKYRFILVDNDKYIDRLNIKIGENAGCTAKDSIFEDWIVKADNWTLAVALGCGSGGSYYYESGSKQQKLHGCLVGHRFSSTNTRPVNRTEIDLRDFGGISLTEIPKSTILKIDLSKEYITSNLMPEEIRFIQSAFTHEEYIQAGGKTYWLMEYYEDGKKIKIINPEYLYCNKKIADAYAKCRGICGSTIQRKLTLEAVETDRNKVNQNLLIDDDQKIIDCITEEYSRFDSYNRQIQLEHEIGKIY